MSVEGALQTLLQADAQVRAMIGRTDNSIRFHPIEVPAATTGSTAVRYPAIAHLRVDDVDSSITHDVPEGGTSTMRLQLTHWADTWGDARELDRRTRAVLSGVHHTTVAGTFLDRVIRLNTLDRKDATGKFATITDYSVSYKGV